MIFEKQNNNKNSKYARHHLPRQICVKKTVPQNRSNRRTTHQSARARRRNDRKTHILPKPIPFIFHEQTLARMCFTLCHLKKKKSQYEIQTFRVCLLMVCCFADRQTSRGFFAILLLLFHLIHMRIHNSLLFMFAYFKFYPSISTSNARRQTLRDTTTCNRESKKKKKKKY